MNTIIANTVEKAMGHRDTVTTTEYKEDESGATMLALRWYGNQDVRVETVPKPALTESKDAIIKVSDCNLSSKVNTAKKHETYCVKATA